MGNTPVPFEGTDAALLCLANAADIARETTVPGSTSVSATSPRLETDRIGLQCRHHLYEAGTSYKEQAIPGYCKESYHLFNLRCAGTCERIFAHEIKDDQVDSSKFVVPSTRSPIMECENIMYGGSNCMHTMCMACFTAKIIESDNNNTGNKRSSRRRTAAH